MGAWLMILVAIERPHRIHSLIGVSSALDFTQRAFSRFSPEARIHLMFIVLKIFTHFQIDAHIIYS